MAGTVRIEETTPEQYAAMHEQAINWRITRQGINGLPFLRVDDDGVLQMWETPAFGAKEMPEPGWRAHDASDPDHEELRRRVAARGFTFHRLGELIIDGSQKESDSPVSWVRQAEALAGSDRVSFRDGEVIIESTDAPEDPWTLEDWVDSNLDRPGLSMRSHLEVALIAFRTELEGRGE